MEDPQNCWFIRGNPIPMDDNSGYPHFNLRLALLRIMPVAPNLRLHVALLSGLTASIDAQGHWSVQTLRQHAQELRSWMVAATSNSFPLILNTTSESHGSVGMFHIIGTI